MEINKITIDRLLPNVFKGMEDTSQIRESRIWDSPPFIFERGCRLCIHAESGGGKSSLLSFIYGNRKDYTGEIFFNDTDIRNLSIKQWCGIRSENIALLPQEMRLFQDVSAMENILIKNSLTLFKKESEIEEMLDRLGILNKRDTLVSKLSIGQQQRVAIVRTLCQPFDFIFLDEPVSHLDEKNNRIVAELVENEARKNNAGIITTSVGNHLMLKDPDFIKL